MIEAIHHNLLDWKYRPGGRNLPPSKQEPEEVYGFVQAIGP